ncbi:MAG TPA: glycosyltransferase family 4 protein [Terracidiphilus sp.]|nr:glycosyltransferase family 4 protein [Terracidiphilus sp.]
MIQKSPKVYLHAWTGNAEKGLQFIQARYPSAEITTLAHRELRESGWAGQIRALARLRGTAIVFYFRSLADVKEPELLVCLHLIHGCSESVLADEAGNVTVISLKDCLRRLPKIALSLTVDVAVFAVTWLLLSRLQKSAGKGVPVVPTEGAPDIAYIYPYPLNRDFSGGATTHFCGFLQGLAENQGTCLVISGCKFPFTLPFPVADISLRRKLFVFSESLILWYNWQFVRDARVLLAGRRPRAIYQRHGRFVIAGVLLARRLRVPMVLEYNGSEVWMANHWDPARFSPWLRMAEEVAIQGASTIVTVSEALRSELIAHGVPHERILVNPNGVNPSRFCPGSGHREELRQRLGFESNHIVVAFAGTFSYWHGIEVLQAAIKKLLVQSQTGSTSDAVGEHLRFLLIGQGPLHAEMRAALDEYERQGFVVFVGSVPHDEMPGYLDAADVLASPHVPMPDGRPFIGSPTKLFEYMAMGKAIVASRLDQLEAVLEHNKTALMVHPGDADDLAAAILVAAANPDLRSRLGRNAREVVLKRYTWKRNAADTMMAAGLRSAAGESLSQRQKQG